MTIPNSPGITVTFTSGAPDPVQVTEIEDALRTYNNTDPIKTIGIVWAHGSNTLQIPYTVSGDSLNADRIARAIVASALFDAHVTVTDAVIAP